MDWEEAMNWKEGEVELMDAMIMGKSTEPMAERVGTAPTSILS